MGHKRRLWVVLADMLATAVAYVLAYLVRFDGLGSRPTFDLLVQTLPLLVLIRAAVFTGFGLYRGVWSYASITDLIAVVKAVIAGTAAFAVALLLLGVRGHSRGILLVEGVFVLVLVGALRLSLRYWRLGIGPGLRRAGRTPVLIIGAGDTGEMVARELLQSAKFDCRPVGFLDDAPERQGQRIHGVPVLGTIEDVGRISAEHRVEQVILAVPSADRRAMRSIFEHCRHAGLRMKTVPGLGKLLAGTARVTDLSEVRLEDLLRREATRLDPGVIRASLQGRRVLVTGAGGSIGSEICRQVAACEPALLVLLDKAESPLFDIEAELGEAYPGVPCVAALVDIKHGHKLAEVFGRRRPEVVFDAAAYKHVPLMELHPDEAVLNNVVGTRQLVEAAIAFGVERFVLISTDKAVNPSSVMGATKRVAERYLQTLAADLACGATVLCAVRFGNVLGSSGSVVPTFRRQIEQGGPLTITHPEVTRYFMTIPEAVQLVLRAATLAQGGDIFVLDMGEPVKIADLARDIVRLSGLELGRDIDLLFTGLRPGEKLHEELWNATEDVEPTAQDKLLVIRRPEAEAQGSARLLGQLSEMERLAKAGDTPDLIRAMRRVVPEYQPASPGLHVRRRVLVADDDAKVRETIQAVLGDLYEVSVATDGEQVLRQARAHLPDLILLDIVMPRMDGHAVCEALRSDARTRRLPIIILSALADVADKVKGLGLGADDYITKPFQIEELRARVQMVLRRAYAG